ncbi:MAG: hypothetical protein K9M45_03500 [Kiritimatiellales bacterium]|nr:hypothetical protein [Kiritimatiellales bacterium]
MKTRLFSAAVVLAALTIISPVFGANTINTFIAGDGYWTNATGWLDNTAGSNLVPNISDYDNQAAGLTTQWARVQSLVFVDHHVPITSYRIQVGNNNSPEGTLAILSGASLTNAQVLTVSQAGSDDVGNNSIMVVEGDYIQLDQAMNVGTVALWGVNPGKSDGTLIVDGGTVTLGADDDLNVGAYNGNASYLDMLGVGAVEVMNGGSITMEKIEINGRTAIGAAKNDSSVIVNDSTFTMTGSGATQSQLDGSLHITNSSVKLNEIFVNRNSRGISIIGGAGANDLILPELRADADAVISNVVISGSEALSKIVVAGNVSNTAATVDLHFLNAVTNLDGAYHAGHMLIAHQTNTTGTLNFSGGTIHFVDRELQVANGVDSTGALNVDGGQITGELRLLKVGTGKNSHGEAYISGGSLTVGRLTNGTIALPDSFVVGNNSNAYAKAELIGASAFIRANAVNVGGGTDADATLIISGGTITNDEAVSIATSARSMGVVSLTNVNWVATGAQNDDNTKHFTIGANAGTGTLTMVGGTLHKQDVNGFEDIRVGVNANAYGEFNIIGDATVTADDYVYVGLNNDANGVLMIEGSTLNTEQLSVGQGLNANGTINIKAGSTVNIGTTTTGAGYFNVGNNIGYSATGTVNMSGGTLNMLDINDAALRIGQGGGNGAVGNFDLSGGTVNATNLDVLVGNGAGGNGTLNISGTGTFNAMGTGTAGEIQIANNASGTGTVNATGGTLITRNLQVGSVAGGIGILVVDGAAVVNVGNALNVAYNGTGTATIKGGTVNVDILRVANQPSATSGGTLIIEGGTVNVGTDKVGDGHFSIGNASNGVAVVNMSGGTVNMLDDDGGTAGIRLGFQGQGFLNLTNGTINATNMASVIGSSIDGNGTLNVAGGTWNAFNRWVTLADNIGSTGIVNVSSGSFLAKELRMGANAAGVGIINITGGSVDVDLAARVGLNGAGFMTIDGPTASVTVSNLFVANNVGSTGSVTLLAGNLVVNGNIATSNPTNGFIDVAGGAASLKWTGRNQTNFENLWNTGKIRSGGESGLTGAIFGDYLQVAADVLTIKQTVSIGDIVIGGPVTVGPDEGMILAWDSDVALTYGVEYRNDLITDGWQTYTNASGVYTNIIGTGGSISVTTVVEEVTQSYRVIAE